MDGKRMRRRALASGTAILLLIGSAVLTPNLWLATALAAWLGSRVDARQAELSIEAIRWGRLEVRDLLLIQPQRLGLERASGQSLTIDWTWRQGQMIVRSAAIHNLRLDLQPRWRTAAQHWLERPPPIEHWFNPVQELVLPDLDIEQLRIREARASAGPDLRFRLHLRQRAPFHRLFLAGAIDSMPLRSQIIIAPDLLSLTIETEGAALDLPATALADGEMHDDPLGGLLPAAAVPETVLAVAGKRSPDGSVQGSLQADPESTRQLLELLLGPGVDPGTRRGPGSKQGVSLRWQTAPGSATIRATGETWPVPPGVITPGDLLDWIAGIGHNLTAAPER